MTRTLSIALLTILSTGFYAGTATAEDKLQPRVFLSVDKLPAGGTCEVAVLLQIEEDWHVCANPVAEDWQIPTSLSVTAENGTKLVQTLYPAGESMTIQGARTSVYEGRVLLFATLSVPESAAGTSEKLTFKVRYQACNDQTCLAPTTVSKPGSIPVAAVGEKPTAINPKIFAMKQAIAATGTVVR